MGQNQQKIKTEKTEKPENYNKKVIKTITFCYFKNT
jgi:hypothetical protein